MMIVSIVDVSKELIKDFDCGNDDLNRYLKEFALQNNKKNISKTFVFLENNEILGYYSLSSAQIGFEDLTKEMVKSLPKYPFPAVRLARLAIAKNKQKIGLGSMLLKDAFLRILNISKQVGVYFIIFDAKEESKLFYERFGFIKLESFKLTYVLQISTVQKAYELSIKQK